MFCFGILDLTFCSHHAYNETRVVHYKHPRQSGVGKKHFHKCRELYLSLKVNNNVLNLLGI